MPRRSENKSKLTPLGLALRDAGLEGLPYKVVSNDFAEWGQMGVILRSIEPVWMVVQLSPWLFPDADEGMPSIVYLTKDEPFKGWSFDLDDHVLCFSYRNALKVASELSQPDWSNGPALALGLADEYRNDEQTMKYSTTRRIAKPGKWSQKTLDRLKARGRFTDKMVDRKDVPK